MIIYTLMLGIYVCTLKKTTESNEYINAYVYLGIL